MEIIGIGQAEGGNLHAKKIKNIAKKFLDFLVFLIATPFRAFINLSSEELLYGRMPNLRAAQKPGSFKKSRTRER